ncbi:MAG TPA: MFS transporter [Stellaceae bacterium]|nr:MFS transporter [Stellaceae bacterium]
MALAEVANQPSDSFRWKVVAFAFLLAAFAWGVGFYGPSVFLRTLHADRGWAISTISAAITMHFLFGAILVAYLPEAHRRFGIARVTQAGIAFAVLGILAWANARQPWQLFPAALTSGAGWAATSGAAINAIVAPWFDKERPKALGLAFNGASIGGLVFTPLWVALIGKLGFATAAAAIGIAMAAILWPVTMRYLQPRPSGVGAAAGPRPLPLMGHAALLRDRRFVTISAAFALGFFAQVGLFAHLLTRLAPEFGSSGAALAISLTAVFAVAGRTLLGWLIGEGDRRTAASVNFLVQACGTLLLIFGSGMPLLLCGCMLFGLGVGNLVSLPPLIIQKEFAAGDVGRAVALTVAINQAVFAFAPAVVGVLRDLAGGYAAPFALVAAMQLGAAVIVSARRKR